MICIGGLYRRAVPREPKAQRQARAREVLERLHTELPEARIQLEFQTPLELLVSVMLSAQCTDARVNQVTPALFARYRSARDYANADLAELQSYIRTCGLFRNKAKNLVATGRALVENYGGTLPRTREALQSLPGVGRKTAGVVVISLGSDDAFPVDTHIKRLAHRLGLSREDDPDKVERDLQALVPREWWARGHQLLIWHGRRTCTARAPACERCVLASLCPKLGVKARSG